MFDQYFEHSIKQLTRDKRGTGQRVAIKPQTKINDFKSFLQHNDNKTDLFRLLVVSLTATHRSCQIVCTSGNSVLTTNPECTMNKLFPCNLEEANTRMFLKLLKLRAKVLNV